MTSHLCHVQNLVGITMLWFGSKWNLHWIGILMEKLLVKWALVAHKLAQDICSTSTDQLSLIGSNLQRNKHVIILTKFSSLAALEVVILTTSSAASDENFIKMKTLPFQFNNLCSNHQDVSHKTTFPMKKSAGVSGNLPVFPEMYNVPGILQISWIKTLQMRFYETWFMIVFVFDAKVTR